MLRGMILAVKEEKGLKRVTGGQPAALSRICGRPLLEYSIDLLAAGGVEKAVIFTAGRKPGMEARFDGAVKCGVALRVAAAGSPESSATEIIRGGRRSTDTLVVLDGGALAAFDLAALLKQHLEKNCDATQVLAPYGAPGGGEYYPAAYILSSSAAAALPEGEAFGRKLMCRLSGLGLRTEVAETKGFVLPVRDETEYLRCQRELLFGSGERWGISPGTRDAQGNVIHTRLPAGCHVTPPVFVGRKVEIGRGAQLMSGTVLDDFSSVGDRVQLKGVTVLPGGSAAGSGGMANTILCPDGLEGDKGILYRLLRIGQALGAVCRGKEIALGWDGAPLSQAAAYIFCGGLMASGADVLDFGRCLEPVYQEAWRNRTLEAGAYFCGGEDGWVRLTSPGGLPLAGKLRRDLEELREMGCFSPLPREMAGNRRKAEDPVPAYIRALQQMAPGSLWGVRCRVVCANEELRRFAGRALSQLGCRPGEDRLILAPGGGECALVCRDGRRFSWEDILAILCTDRLACGADVAVPDGALGFLEQMAAEQGKRVLRYLSVPGEGRDAAARSLAREQPWIRDGLMAAVAFLSFMRGGSFLLTAAPLSKYNKTIANNLCKMH